MKQKFNVGDRVRLVSTGETATIVDITKCAYYCYWVQYDDGTIEDGYFNSIDIELIK